MPTSTSAPDAFALDTRHGLPDALRALVEAHPRETWAAHPNFGGLVRFWLDRHLMFRRLNDDLLAGTERMIEGDIDARAFGATLARDGSVFVGELIGHHNIEDVHYFPVLSRRETGLSRGFEILDRDHHALDARLDGFVQQANAVLQDLGASDLPDRTGALHEALGRFARLLDRHLTDEEDLVVPVILKHGPHGLG